MRLITIQEAFNSREKIISWVAEVNKKIRADALKGIFELPELLEEAELKIFEVKEIGNNI